MNPDLDRLHPYPFEKLAELKKGIIPLVDKAPIALSIGEPKFTTPNFIHDAVTTHINGIAKYPTTKRYSNKRT